MATKKTSSKTPMPYVRNLPKTKSVNPPNRTTRGQRKTVSKELPLKDPFRK